MALTCQFCKREVSPNAATTYRKVTGWVARRTQGGSNAIRLRQEHDEFACGQCIDLAKRGHVNGQMGFEEVM